MWQLFISSIRSGFRGRLFLGVFLFAVALVGVAFLSSSFSPRQPQTVALDVGLSGIRLGLALFAIVLVQELVGREVERRTVVLTLAYPIPRASYLFGRYLGILALTITAMLILALLLWIVVFVSGGQYEQQFPVYLGAPYLICMIGIFLDIAIITAFTLWIASLSTVTMLPLVLGMLFTIAARALGAVFDYISRGAGGDTELAQQFGPALNLIRIIIPDLSRLDWRTWPMYGIQTESNVLLLGMISAVCYILIMFGLATYAFSRREFT